MPSASLPAACLAVFLLKGSRCAVQLTISADSHIYQIDSPGKITSTRGSSVEWAQIVDFKDVVYVNLYGVQYQCSDFLKWHSQTYLVPKPNDNLNFTRDTMNKQKLGAGWINVPNTPP
jgi:hypothetical protein